MLNLSEKDMIFQYYSEMRGNGGTVFDKEEGVWKSFSYDHVKYILAHDELFSSDPRSIHNHESYSDIKSEFQSILESRSDEVAWIESFILAIDEGRKL